MWAYLLWGQADERRLVNMQAVIADTQRGIEQVQRKIDALLSVDTDSRALVRLHSSCRGS
jgi:hypothetical protein